MTTEAQGILDEALRLPDDARAEIAGRLLDSIDVDRPIAFDADTLKEAKRRLEDLRSGKVVGIPAEDVIAAARARSNR